jgi:hypothetical protein
MTRDVLLRVQHRALMRREGRSIEVDRAEGRAMAAQLHAGATLEAIAERHALSRRRVQRRLYTIGIWQVAP